MQPNNKATAVDARLEHTEHDTLMALGFPFSPAPPRAEGGEEGEAPQPESMTRQAQRPRTRRVGARRLRTQLREFAAEERGAVTAEYALVIMAAVAFAGLLIAILRSDEVRAMLVNLVQTALGSAG